MLLGFTTREQYVRECLGISPRKARGLVALERRAWEAPALMAALEAGTLSWLRASLILPVAHDTVAVAWIARAHEINVRRLSDEVEWARDREEATLGWEPVAPPPPGAVLRGPEAEAEAERQVCAPRPWEEPVAKVAFSAPVSIVALFRAALTAFAEPCEAPWRGLERLLIHVHDEWARQPRAYDFVADRCATDRSERRAVIAATGA